MKRQILLILALALPFSGLAGTVEVRIKNPPESGFVVLQLFDSADDFSDLRKAYRTMRLPCEDRGDYTLADVPAGRYALLVFHDVNNNNRLDRSFIGIPTEPLGFSNSYRPKGPPSYARAVFDLADQETAVFDVTLARPLGELGRIGVGVGAIARTSPYRDSDGGVLQVIPAVTYIGETVQILGPRVQVGLVGSGNVRAAATLRYRVGSYEESDSPILEGMGDRDDTLMAGLAVEWELPGGVDVSAEYEHDTLDRVGGCGADLTVRRPVQWGIVRLTPGVGVAWQSSNTTADDYGVPAKRVIPGRPAYNPGAAWNPRVRLGGMLEITDDLMFILDAGVEILDSRISDSPIVDEDYVVEGFSALTYVF